LILGPRDAYDWDAGPQVPWVLVAGGSPSFISYDDERSVAAKIGYGSEADTD